MRKCERSRMLFVCAVCALQLLREGFLSCGLQATESVILGASWWSLLPCAPAPVSVASGWLLQASAVCYPPSSRQVVTLWCG